MSQGTAGDRPDWVSDEMLPFESRFFTTPRGHQMHYTFTGKPALVLWGNKDIAFRTKELDRWRAEIRDCQVHEFADCGHFLAEEARERILPLLRDFMQ